MQSIRGMNDILPEVCEKWQELESIMQDLAESYGYSEIRFPLLEQITLFKRSIGEATDIIEKEMYTFADRNNDMLALRPEGTASCVRAAIQHGLLHNQIQKLYYLGPMYRHERPQKGRYRQFYQFGLEVFGIAEPSIDAEIIAWTARLWELLDLRSTVKLQINSLGTKPVREKYREVLVRYLEQHEAELDTDSRTRLYRNPLRVLDSKNPDMAEIVANSPKLMDYLDEESKQHFRQLCSLLDALNIHYQVNPYLVRGLDYYTHTVFEWVTEELGAQNTLCAGGRYNDLVEQIGGRSTPAIGLSLGMERVIELLEVNNFHFHTMNPDAYFILLGEAATHRGLVLAEQLRNEIEDIQLVLNHTAGSVKSQLKRADKSGANLAFILGEEELDKGNIVVKSLREDAEQQIIAQNELVSFLKKSYFLEG